MTRNPNLNGYDATRYRNFDGERAAERAIENLFENQLIAPGTRRKLLEHFEEGSTARSPAELAAEVPQYAIQHAHYFATIASEVEVPKCKRRYYDEADFSFGLAVVHELIARDEWGAVEYAVECARGMGEFGPVACAEDQDLEPDPRDGEAVAAVADAISVSYGYFAEGVEVRETGIQYGPTPAEKSDESQRDVENARLNDGKDDGTHKVYAELARLENEGVRINGHRIVHTPESDFPDFLEVQYDGVSSSEIEELQYRYIDSTDCVGIAARPLSEIPTLDDDGVSK